MKAKHGNEEWHSTDHSLGHLISVIRPMVRSGCDGLLAPGFWLAEDDESNKTLAIPGTDMENSLRLSVSPLLEYLV